MSNYLTDISDNNNLDFYIDQAKQNYWEDFVYSVRDNFTNGDRAGFWTAVQALNLWNKQVNAFWDKKIEPEQKINTLKELPLDEEQKHVLFGMILDFAGGYPVQEINKPIPIALKMLEKEFLAYPGQTPEKWYCSKHSKKLPFPKIKNGIWKGPIVKLESIEIELKKKESTTEKLDYWFESIYNLIKEETGIEFKFNISDLTDEEEEEILLKTLGQGYYLVSPILIPHYLHREHFPDWSSNPEYTSWFIPLLAKWNFIQLKKNNYVEENIRSRFGADFIKGQLKQINDIEDNATRWIGNRINIQFRSLTDNETAQAVDYLRVKDEKYYKKNPLPDIFATTGDHPELWAYARHVYYKEYLESNLEPKINTSNVSSAPSQDTEKRKYSANEQALAYIFDLFANGVTVPTNRIEGGLSKKKLLEIGREKGFGKPDTFYRAVKLVLGYDLNRVSNLLSISKDWMGAVKKMSKDWEATERYLRDKGLIGEE